MQNYVHLKICLVFILSALSFNLQAEPIKIGMSTALEGPTSELGKSVKMGIDAYFHRVNKSGGIRGKKLKLITLDDGYDPLRASANMHKLISQDKVVAVIGNLGTPTAVVTVPIANAEKTLMFGSVSGAGLLRKSPPDRYVINYRASFADETASIVNGLIKSGITAYEMAFFTQNDSYGTAGYQGGIEAIKAAGFNDFHSIIHARYTRNTLNVENALSDILDGNSDPKAIIMVGAYKPCARFIQLAKEELPDTLFVNVSFVGSIPLLNELGELAEGVIVTQVVPHYDAALDGVNQYQVDLKAFSQEAEPGFLSLEGYISARILVKGLNKADTLLSRESLIDGLDSLGSFDLTIGTTLSLSPTEHQASHTVWPTRVSGGKYVPFDWDSL